MTGRMGRLLGRGRIAGYSLFNVERTLFYLIIFIVLHEFFFFLRKTNYA